MALTLASAEPQRPDANLMQALYEYENVLTEEDKKLLRAQQHLPPADAAIQLAGLIDQKCSSRRARCMGPRLTLFLEYVQQFSHVADTFVSSHPEVAALVCGGVKMTLLAANNINSYFDQLSALLMNIGTQSPRIRGLGCLYPSLGLQKALCDYSTCIIRLCKHIMQSLQRSVYSQLSRALFISFKAEFGPYEEQLFQLSQAVKEEASLASKQEQQLEHQLQTKERSKMEKSRNALLKFTEFSYNNHHERQKRRLEIDRRRLERDKLRCLDSLSTYDYQITYRQIRKQCVPGTSQWICQDPAFQNWLRGSVDTLWFSGRLGSGKSVTSASVVTHLIDNSQPEYKVCFFFCRFDDNESLQAKTVTRSISRQMISSISADTIDKIRHDIHIGTDFSELLESVLSPTHIYLVILDGLDECEKAQTKEIGEFFSPLLRHPTLRIKIFWSSRPKFWSWLPKSSPIEQHINLESSENQEKLFVDIQTLIRVQLEELLEGQSPELTINDPSTIERVQNKLENKAHGMFLWVKLQLQALRDKCSDDQILAALENLPPDLPQTFQRALLQSNKRDDENIGRRIFGWLLVVKRPLTVGELQEAISIKPLQEIPDPNTFIHSIDKALSHCGNLAFVDEERQTVHLTHSSVKLYFVSSDIERPLQELSFTMEEADAEVGIACITYLNFPVFSKQLKRQFSNIPTTSDVISTVVERSSPLSKSANRIALRLLTSRSNFEKPMDSLLENSYQNINHRRWHWSLGQYPFRSYAERFWIDHTKHSVKNTSKKAWHLFRTLIEEADQRTILHAVTWRVEDVRDCSQKIMNYIVENNHCSLALLLMTQHLPLSRGHTDFLHEEAASRGHLELMALCLDFAPAGMFLSTSCLWLAVQNGHTPLVERLIKAGALVSCPNKTGGRTALMLASEHGHLAVVERLLKENIDINARDKSSRTATWWAIESSHSFVLQRLLQEKPNLEIFDALGRCALHFAAVKGNSTVVEQLLRAGADRNTRTELQDHTYWHRETALHLAARNGHLDSVKVLIEGGSYIDAEDDSRYTALHRAADCGYPDIVEILLEARAKVDARSKGGSTPLHKAAINGDLAVLKQLIKAGADLNAEGDGHTALTYASTYGYEEAVEVLTQAGADVNGGSTGASALHYATWYGHVGIVQKLLDVGADVNAKNSFGWTPLQFAKDSGFGKVADKLVAAGGTG